MEEFFDNKKILIVVPHQDDEINVASGILSLNINKNNIYVVYTTNGDFSTKASIRYDEALKSLKCFGIKKDNIFFLGYSDQSYSQQTHMYNSNSDWISNSGIKRTYGSLGIKEWCYKKHNKHNYFNKDNLCKDLKEIIVDIMPDIIVGIDLDFHSDHIMTSLLLEKAVGQVLKEFLNYHPIFLKTFAYENAYFGSNDFNNLNEYGMKFKKENKFLKNNVYYTDDNILIFSLNQSATTLNLRKNIVFKAILKHSSQLLILHAFQILNSNSVYWYRNTNNLINKAKISVSSGNLEFLNDFMLADTKNVLNGNQKDIIYDERIWIPDKNDNEKIIKINFPKKEYISCLKLYSGKNRQKIKNIKLFLDDDIIDYKLNNEYIDTILIDKEVSKVCIQISDNYFENGFSEVELLKSDELIYKFFKVNIDDTWSNNFICTEDKEKKYTLNLKSNYSDSFKIVSDNLINGRIKGKNIYLSKKTRGYFDIYDSYDNYNERIYINKNVLRRKTLILFNHIYIKFLVFYCKIERKFKNLVK